ncbi:hypothetical protein [Pseudomonas poae]|uniref:Uncharacterized protein n=1 Tax=Pseudomonas poae TaxID=200451 RepID=A0AAP2S283_9PSED|nr:hypothetical protein [Pseudomonas poae]MCF5656183.1 hypothetical protein [Pseudomonas poae]
MDMQGKYFLSTSSHELSPKLEISEFEYNKIVNARKTLSAALNIEETYDLVLGNFLDLEKEMLLLTLDKIFDHRFDYKKAYDVLSSINRKFTNFVLSAKNYTELIDSMTSKSANNKEGIKATVKAIRAKHYTENSDYRFMEALRNHLSHFGGAVHLILNPDKWLTDEKNQAKNLVFNMCVYALKERLAENEKFKKTVYDELPEKVDLKKAARSYVGAISNIHEQVRNITKTATTEARLTIETHLESYKKMTDGDSFIVGAYSDTAYQTDEAPTLLLLEWDDVRLELLKRNQSVSNMEKRHITSAIVNE